MKKIWSLHLHYHNLPLVPYVLMQLVQIKRLGPGKFYLSHKGDHFIKGNPSFHKGWMSRFFFVRRVAKKRDPWKCEMHWRDNMYTLTPRTPDRSPNLAYFLDAMRGKSIMLPSLSRNISSASLVLAGGGRTNGQGGDAEDDGGGGRGRLLGRCRAPKKGPKKRRASTQPKKEARREKKKKEEASTSGSRPERIPEEGRAPTPSKRTPEDGPKFTPIITIAEASSPKKKGPGRVPPLDYTEDSLVASPSGVVATRYICNMAPDRDIDLLMRADDSEAVSHFATQITSAMAGGGEVVRRLTRVHRAVTTTRRSFDEAMGQHDELVARLEELEALRSELDAALAKKTSIEVELEETKAHAEEEVGCLKSEVIHVWDRSKEEFLQSSEFDTLCTNKSLRYFKDSFAGCLDQFRANDYSEEEHRASFLDAKKALMKIPDEEAEEEEEDQGDADATPPPPELPP
ncbi:hypothetical protein F511_42538 [Dorcoceras hygrometricum]|uniref:Uncharacterized protein n=1 Tax=Dorcoceras hygrometricum TaxID=472368 RepID=A0A2Z7CPK7_9LAMI|nr:hypothetical protein F511_42538 [Dorcoceras hygrometricum]